MITSASEFATLRVSDNPEDQARASVEAAEIGVWLSIIEERPELRSWVAHNKTVPIEILALLANDADPQVRATVAGKRKLTLDLQRQLANDPDASVRARVVHNAKVDASILMTLASDSETFVREAATEKIRTLGHK